MSNIVRDQYGRAAQSDAVKQLLGLGTAPLPAEGMPARDIQGVRVWVAPLEPRPWLRRNFTGLRVRCCCPTCGKEVALGRLPQHMKAHRVPVESPDYDPGQRPRS